MTPNEDPIEHEFLTVEDVAAYLRGEPLRVLNPTALATARQHPL